MFNVDFIIAHNFVGDLINRINEKSYNSFLNNTSIINPATWKEDATIVDLNNFVENNRKAMNP